MADIWQVMMSSYPRDVTEKVSVDKIFESNIMLKEI